MTRLHALALALLFPAALLAVGCPPGDDDDATPADDDDATADDDDSGPADDDDDSGPADDDDDSGPVDDDDSAPAGPFVFSTADPDTYVQVDRAGQPAVSTALVSSRDAYNAAGPADDIAGTFLLEVLASVEVLHTSLDDDLEDAGLTPCGPIDPGDPSDQVGECIQQGLPHILPDVLTLSTAEPSGYPNGRLPSDPVGDAVLALVLLDLAVHDLETLAGLPLNPPTNDVVFPEEFPWLAEPHAAAP